MLRASFPDLFYLLDSPSLYRIAVANLLGVPDRIDWKACAQSESEERSDAAAFKAAFTPFDPSVQ